MAAPLIGLDIGSSAVRAAELASGRGGLALRRFGQVGLPQGAVVEGEVLQPDVVASALRRLWAEVGFESRRVVLGVSSQRVIVRQAEVTAMPAADFRSAVKFEAQDLIPIPADDAVLGFSIVEPDIGARSAGGPPDMRILLAAAHREMVARHLEALKLASLRADAIDMVPLALMRAARRSEQLGDDASRMGAEAVISVGAMLTVVSVRQGTQARFVRTLNTGGAHITRHLVERLGLGIGAGEAAKRADGSVATTVPISEMTRPLVEEIRQSIEFFLAQSEVDSLDRVLLTGGALLTSGLVGQLREALTPPLELVDPFEGLDTSGSGLSEEDLRRAGPFALAPIGLAEWAMLAPTERITLLPAEVSAANLARRNMALAAVAVLVVGGALGGAWAYQHHRVAKADSEASVYQGQITKSQAQVNSLSDVNSYFAAVDQRAQMLAAATSSDVDLPEVLHQIASQMPPGTTLTDFSVSPAPAASSGTTGSAPSGTPSGAKVTMSVKGAGGEAVVASWLRAMARVPSLTNAWVASSSVAKGRVTFVCTAELSSKAPRELTRLGGSKL